MSIKHHTDQHKTSISDLLSCVHSVVSKLLLDTEEGILQTKHGNERKIENGMKGKENDVTHNTSKYLKHQTLEGFVSSLSDEKLDSQLKPVLECIEMVDPVELLHLESVHFSSKRGSNCGKRLKVRPIHDQIEPRVSNSNVAKNVVRYLHVHEEDLKYSVGVFVFPPGARIPLHDHPGMCVISYVLYGDLTVRSFDWVENMESSSHQHSKMDGATVDNMQNQGGYFSFTSTAYSWFFGKLGRDDVDAKAHKKTMSCANMEHHQKLRRRRACLVTHQKISSKSATSLYPKKGNIHEFTAGPGGAAVLDVLLPPYDIDNDRDCNFYEVQLPDNKGENDVGATYWLVPIAEPKNFHCVGGAYAGLGE